MYIEGPAFELEATADYRSSRFPSDPSNFGFNHNIVVDLRPAYGSTGGIVELATYADDVMFKHVSQQLRFHSNCYSNVRTSVSFALAASRTPGKAGSRYDIFDWKALGYDKGSVLANPAFVDSQAGDLRLKSTSACQGKGSRVFRTPH